MSHDWSIVHKEICKKYGVSYCRGPLNLKVGISENVKAGVFPVNGLRHPPQGDTTGWYIWAGGEIPQDDLNFFSPLHVIHLEERCPDIIKYLGLPPGWRFLFAPDYEDVWEDISLLDV
jgi:hypothetical protein